MNVQLPAGYESLVQKLIAEGRFRSEAEVIAEGLRLIDTRERLREDVEAGLAALDAGERVAAEAVYAEARRRLENRQ